jgi:hypothetical protein
MSERNEETDEADAKIRARADLRYLADLATDTGRLNGDRATPNSNHITGGTFCRLKNFSDRL